MEIEVVQLIWDEVNTKHIWDKHRLNQEEVEQAVLDKDSLATRLPNGRVLMLGLTERNKLLSLILSPRDTNLKVWYPVTARMASKKEHKLYEEKHT